VSVLCLIFWHFGCGTPPWLACLAIMLLCQEPAACPLLASPVHQLGGGNSAHVVCRPPVMPLHRWIKERKRSFPTSDNKAKKEADAAARRERGEIDPAR